MPSPSLKTVLAGIPLDSCLYNASGPRTGSAAALSKIAASSSTGAVLAKSATVNKQLGNPQPRTWQSTSASLNSEGLPNAGIDYYLDERTIQEAMMMDGGGDDCHNKPYMISISGKTLQDNVTMIQQVIAVNKKAKKTANITKNTIASLELNLACPNVIGKPIIAYDFDQLDDVLKAVSEIKDISSSSSYLVLGVKMPPYFDGPHFQAAAKILNKYKSIVKYVATINTIGNALCIDSVAEMPVISSRGFAGLSGRAVKYTALANVRQLRLLLDEEIDVVGVGGVETGEDAFELILCGAAAVQIGTCHWREGPKCFDRIAAELKDIMTQKGYRHILDFQGKLKEWNKEGANASRAARKKNGGGAVIIGGEDSSSAKKKSSGGSEQLLLAANVLLMIVLAWLLADKYGIVTF